MLYSLFLLVGASFCSERPTERVPSTGIPHEDGADTKSNGMDNVSQSPECLQIGRLEKTGIYNVYEYTRIQSRVFNKCGKVVLAFGGSLELRDQQGLMRTQVGLWSSHANIPINGYVAENWDFRVLVKAEDIWLYAVPQQSLLWSWTTSFVLLSDGTVYRSDVPLPVPQTE